MKWSKENYYHNLSSPYCLRLASGDASGKIIVWDVVSGTAHCEIQEHSKPIQGKGCFKKPRWLSLLNWIDWSSTKAVQKMDIYMHTEVLLAICFHLDTLAISLCPSLGGPHDSVLLIPTFSLCLCQIWSGCGIRMPRVTCCWPSTLPTTLSCGMETRAPSCGRRAMLRTSSPFPLTPSTPPTWRVGVQQMTFHLDPYLSL